MSKRISVQWRITILTALLIAAACVSLNLLLFYSGPAAPQTHILLDEPAACQAAYPRLQFL